MIRDTFLANTREWFAEDRRADYAPRIKRKPSVWATEVRVRLAGTSPLSHGQDMRQDHSWGPHAVEIMDAVDEPGIRKVVFWSAIRDFKTDSALNIIGRTITDCPANIYSVHPTDDNASAFSIGDVESMIEACLNGYVVEKKSRDTGRTIEFKKFKGGWIRIVSANALDKFRGTSVGVLLLHELDALNPEAIFKAFGRATGFDDAIIFMEGTGTLSAEIEEKTGKKIYRSNIEEAYDQGDKRKWFCACRKCGYLQTLKYEQIRRRDSRLDQVDYFCEACYYPHPPKEWRKLAAAGKWYPTAGLSESQANDIAANYHLARAIDPSVRSYWRNGFNSLLPHSKGYASKLHQFIAEGEAAQTSVVARMIWTQEVKAELWSPESEGEAPPAWKPIFDRRESYGLTVPKGGLFLTAFVDCQLNRLECAWRAWGCDEESWGMDHIVINGHVRDREVWQMLRHELSRKWVRVDGAEMRLGMAFVDGGAYAEDVYRFFQELARNPMPGVTGNCRASKGIGQQAHPIITRKMMTIAKNLKGHHIGTWEAKDRLYERLRMSHDSDRNMESAGGVGAPPAALIAEDNHEGVMHFNERYTEEYFQQLVVEQVTVTFERGQEVRKYVNPKNLRNEALDIEVGNLAAFRLFPRNLDALEAELKERAEIAKGAKQAPRQDESEGFTGKGWKL